MPDLAGQFDSMPSGLGVMFLANELEERLRVERLVAALVSLDLLSHDKRQSEGMERTESILRTPTPAPALESGREATSAFFPFAAV